MGTIIKKQIKLQGVFVNSKEKDVETHRYEQKKGRDKENNLTHRNIFS